uniref:Neogenin n=1 Tax=Oncorhynchus mykiss TaxID=8022 RepID=A0A8K9WQY4_ONCMY
MAGRKPSNTFLSLLIKALLQGEGLGNGMRFVSAFPFWFSVEPWDTLAVRGAPALLNCSAHSGDPASEPTAPQARVEWKKDGTFLSLAPDDGRRRVLPDGSLLISSVVHSKHNKPDEGTYQCVATIDSLGTIASRTARLTVAGMPRFSSQPAAASIRLGDSQVLACDVNPDLVPLARWEREREPLELSSRLVQLPNGALVVSNASEADAGLYRCMVENAGPVKTSEEAQLTILPGNTIDTIYEGKLELVGGGSLLIYNLTEEDAGVYSCMADITNNTIEAKAELTVQVPPEFLKRPANIYAHESMDIMFQCEVTGSPAPTVKWVKNGDAVIPSDYFKIINEHNLQVLGLVKSDEGFYQCLAENDAGNMQSSAQLIILEGVANPTGPTPSAPRDVVASLVSTRFIKLTWRPPAEPNGEDLTYSVYFNQEGTNRERILNTSRPGEMQVTIQNLMPDSKYKFRVVAHNKNGLGESSAVLKVATQGEVQVPGPAPNLQAVSTTPTSVTLSWDTPLTGNGDVLTYKVYYMEKGLDLEQDIDAGALSYTLMGLKKFTEYSIRVVAFNKHGPGVSTGDITVTTLSDVPSAPPQNLTVEVHNSKSIMVRWQPPPPGAQNGEITGYKIRYRKGTRKSEAAETTGGTQLFQLIDGLERGTEYTFRVSAITVNGSGPATEWSTAETFESDLDESRVPDIPSSLHVRPLVNSIVVSWTPPENQDMVVRGYTIGYGIGSPHAQTIKVDYKQRYYSIENLDPSSHYVITLKAFNNVGEGIPVYESAITRPQSDPIDPDVDLYELFHAPYTPVPDPTPMLPPVGVQASVLSHDTIKVTWADNSLPKNQKITDARYYTVRWKTNIPANTKLKTANTTNLSHMVTGLKPNTLYEFSVMVTKGRRTSTWSMTAQGTTFETIPSSSPKDVTVVSKELKPRTIIVNWQPPSEANGKITGYIIYYSTDVNAEVHDWVIEPVVGNRLTHQIQELTLDTTYYFKIQARNSKGMGPMSEAVHFRTPKSKCGGGGGPWRLIGSERGEGGGGGGGGIPGGITGSGDNHILVIVVIISVGAFTIIVVVVGAFLCTRRTTSHQKKKRAASKSSNSSHKYKGNSKDLKPPDLWIHHERLELKPIDKSPEPNPVMTDTPIPRTSQDINPVDPSLDNSLLQRRNSYRGQIDVAIHILSQTHHPLTCPPHTPFVTAESVRNTPSTEPLPPQAQPPCQAEHQHPEPEGSYQDSTATDDEPSASGSYCSAGQPPTAHVRPTHPLKSFAVPANPAAIFESPALPSMPLLTQTGPQLHSVKTASIGTLGRVRPPMSVTVPSAPDVPETSKMLEDVDSVSTSYEPDELTEEMAHLEDLMKDLNAITTA